MRAPTLLIALMSVMVVVFAGVALAKVINGDDNDNTLVGTNRADTIRGNGGDDDIKGRKGNDKLYLGSGEDIVTGGDGNDVIRAVDSSQDFIKSCGDGRDRVILNPGDVIGIEDHCRDPGKVIRKGPRVRGPFELF